jgi:hypothetical protein
MLCNEVGESILNTHWKFRLAGKAGDITNCIVFKKKSIN